MKEGENERKKKRNIQNMNARNKQYIKERRYEQMKGSTRK